MKLEPYLWQNGPFPLIGVDEVGRGCLAGPVVAAAVLVDSSELIFDPRITDSKKISEKNREILALEIQSAFKTGLGWASPQEIDEINILQASFLAMERAIEALCVNDLSLKDLEVNEGLVLVDGPFPIPNLKGFRQTPLVKGDLRAQPIGAASILAKVYRDRLMKDLAKEVSNYGFEIHKGYPTKAHKEALQKYGATEHHRRSFRGVESSGPSL